MDGQPAVVIINKAMIPEPVHEVTDPRTGCADHLRQRILIYIGDYDFGLAVLAKMRKQQENPGQPLFAGIEKLVQEIRFISNVS